MEAIESLRRDIIGMVVNGAFIGTGQYAPVIRSGVNGLTAHHLREWDSRLGQLREDVAALVDLVSRQPQEPHFTAVLNNKLIELRDRFGQPWAVFCSGDLNLDSQRAATLLASVSRQQEPVTECCGRAISASDRYCPRCGWECRAAEGRQPEQEQAK